MEFHVKLNRPIADLAVIEDAIRELDPSAQVDIDPEGSKLRVSTWVDAPSLITVVGKAGYPIDPLQVTQLPSVCCGGCGG